MAAATWGALIGVDPTTADPGGCGTGVEVVGDAGLVGDLDAVDFPLVIGRLVVEGSGGAGLVCGGVLRPSGEDSELGPTGALDAVDGVGDEAGEPVADPSPSLVTVPTKDPPGVSGADDGRVVAEPVQPDSRTIAAADRARQPRRRGHIPFAIAPPPPHSSRSATVARWRDIGGVVHK